MKIRMKVTIGGVFHGDPTGVRAGDIVDVDDDNGVRYCRLGYAEPITKTAEKAVQRDAKAVERAVLDEDVETATMGAPVDSPAHPVSKEAAQPDSVVHPESVPEESPTKRSPRK